jgi:preprotein translocase subunit SecA
MLRIIDVRWMDHLQEMDYLKEGIGLRAMGQRDPITEYKNEAYDMFAGLVQSVNEDFLRTLMHMQVVFEPEPELTPALRNVLLAPTESTIFAGATEAATGGDRRPNPTRSPRHRQWLAVGRRQRPSSRTSKTLRNVGRNEPCPCGSGKKYKKCHGANA